MNEVTESPALVGFGMPAEDVAPVQPVRPVSATLPAAETKFQWCCLQSAYEMSGKDKVKLRDMLTAYYSSPKGQQEKQNSPQRDRPLYDFVSDLLTEVD